MNPINDLLLYGHIVGSIFWLGSAGILEALGWRAAFLKKQHAIIEVAEIGEWLSKRVIMPSGLATILFGFLLVIVGRPTFSSFWVLFAIAGIVLSMILGGGFLSKTSHALVTAIREKKSEKTIGKLYSKLTFISRIETAILFIILFDMVVKPKATDTLFFFISATFFLIIFFFSYKTFKKSV